MGEFTKVSDVTLLFETLSVESCSLLDTFKNVGVAVNAVCIEEDGFLPKGVISPFGFFMGDFSEAENIPGKPLFFNQVPVPPYWEISGTGANGKINDSKTEHATIFFTKADNTRLVKIVDWTGDNGKVRISEHYNKYGALFCRTTFNALGQKFARVFFNAKGEEVVYENFVTEDYLIHWNGKDSIIHGKTAFIKFFFKCAGLEETHIAFNSLSFPFFVSEALPNNGFSDALFWNEPIYDGIPGNMKMIIDGNSNRAHKIYVQRHESYEKLIELGASPEIVKELGYVYDFARENNHNAATLILTNSDNIEKLTEIVTGAPKMQFYIAAVTEMSSKLMSMDRHSNVTLYPCASKKTISHLYEKCDIYLDINHEGELYDAVHNAFLNDMLILGFDNTVHNRNYISPTNIFSAEEYEPILMVLNAVVETPELIDMALNQQYEYALAEEPDNYDMNSLF